MTNDWNQIWKDNDLIYWIITIVLLISPMWVIGLVLLLWKLTGQRDRRRQARHPYDLQQEAAGAAYTASARPGPRPGTQGTSYAGRSTPEGGRGGPQGWSGPVRPVNSNDGLALTIGGIVMTVVFGFALVMALPLLSAGVGFFKASAVLSPVIGLLTVGLAMVGLGQKQSRRAYRMRKYLALIGRRESVPVGPLAQAMPVALKTACEDLQYMLNQGYLPAGYLDWSAGRLLLGDAAIPEEPGPDPEPEPAEKAETQPSTEDEILAEIRRLNGSIADPEMKGKIDRIGSITGRIFAYQKQNPNKASQLHSFLSYYLPTTLKILRAYAQMEAQGIEGENIRAAKERIEGMMDKVVEGFEKQLDRLFQNDAMDITADVAVLERMLQKDGLSGDGAANITLEL